MCQVGFFLLCLCVVRGTATVAAPTGLHQGVIIIPSKKGVLCVEDNRRRVPSGTVPVYVVSITSVWILAIACLQLLNI